MQSELNMNDVTLASIAESPDHYQYQNKFVKRLAMDLIILKQEADTLRTQLAEQAALVERLRTALRLYSNHHGSTLGKHPEDADNSQCDQEALMIDRKVNDALSLTPSAALAEYREVVLEEVAKPFDSDGRWKIASEIRAMKGSTR